METFCRRYKDCIAAGQSLEDEAIMKIQPTYLTQIKRIVSEFYGHDGKVTGGVNQALEMMNSVTLGKQHKVFGEMMSLLGRWASPVEVGALLGKRIPVTAFGDISLGIKTAPNLSHALRLVASVHHQIVPLVDYSYSETKSEGRFVVGFRVPIEGKGEALIVSLVALMLESEMVRWTGRSGNIKKLELTSSSKGYEAAYRKHLSLIPDANHVSNVIVIDRAVLDFPNPTADRDAYESVVAASSARAELQEAGLSVRTRERVMSRISDPPSMEALAKSMSMTPRQFRLSLAKENTSYQEILRSCRVEYASALFKNPALSVSQIAHRLGYSDLSAFTHSFCRWTGKSPSTFRIEMLANRTSVHTVTGTLG